MSSSEHPLPVCVTVGEVVKSRYDGGPRPESWDYRVDGIDTVRSTDGSELCLWSNGQQSPPEICWKIVLMSEEKRDGRSCYRWTLYGLPVE